MFEEGISCERDEQTIEYEGKTLGIVEGPTTQIYQGVEGVIAMAIDGDGFRYRLFWEMVEGDTDTIQEVIEYFPDEIIPIV